MSSSAATRWNNCSSAKAASAAAKRRCSARICAGPFGRPRRRPHPSRRQGAERHPPRGRPGADGLRHRPAARGRRSGEGVAGRRTPLYLSPEVIAGADASPQSDIYSLGVLLFHLVTGSYPYVARSLTELRRMQERGERKRLHDLRPDLSEGFVHVIKRALDPVRPSATPASAPCSAGLTHALGLESGLMSPVTLAAIAESDGGLRGSTTLASSGAVRPTGAAHVTLAGLAADRDRDRPRRGRRRLAAARLRRAAAARSPPTPRLARRRAVRRRLVGDRALAEGIGEVVMERVRLLPGVRVVSYSADPAATARSRTVGRCRAGAAPGRRPRPRHSDLERRPGAGARARAAGRRRRAGVRRGVREAGRARRGAAADRRRRDGRLAGRQRVERRVIAAVAGRRPPPRRRSRPTCAAVRRCATCPRRTSPGPSSTSARRSPSTATTGRRSSAWPSATSCRASPTAACRAARRRRWRARQSAAPWPSTAITPRR